MIAILLAAQLHFGPTWGPVREIPVFVAGSTEVRLVSTRYNYREHKYIPDLTKSQRAWMKKHGHILVDWRWDLKTKGWVRKHPKRPLQCLT